MITRLTIKKVVSLLDKGIPISQAKGIIDSNLPDLDSKPSQPSQWNTYRAQLTEAIQSFDEATLTSSIDEVNQFFPADITLRFLLMPIYQTLTETADQTLGKATLQFYEGWLQGILALRLSENISHSHTHHVLFANTSTKADIPLMMLGTLLRSLGIKVTRLAGTNTGEELVQLLNHYHFDAAVLLVDEDSLDSSPDIKCISAETGKPIFCMGQHQTLGSLKSYGLIPLNSGELHQDSLTIRDLLTGIN